MEKCLVVTLQAKRPDTLGNNIPLPGTHFTPEGSYRQKTHTRLIWRPHADLPHHQATPPVHICPAPPYKQRPQVRPPPDSDSR